MQQETETTLFLPVTPNMRQRIETTIESLLALLDEIDGDSESEPSQEGEPSLGWCEARDGRWGNCDDREREDENDEDDDPLENNGDENEGTGTSFDPIFPYQHADNRPLRADVLAQIRELRRRQTVRGSDELIPVSVDARYWP